MSCFLTGAMSPTNSTATGEFRLQLSSDASQASEKAPS